MVQLEQHPSIPIALGWIRLPPNLNLQTRVPTRCNTHTHTSGYITLVSSHACTRQGHPVDPVSRREMGVHPEDSKAQHPSSLLAPLTHTQLGLTVLSSRQWGSRAGSLAIHIAHHGSPQMPPPIVQRAVRRSPRYPSVLAISTGRHYSEYLSAGAGAATKEKHPGGSSQVCGPGAAGVGGDDEGIQGESISV